MEPRRVQKRKTKLRRRGSTPARLSVAAAAWHGWRLRLTQLSFSLRCGRYKAAGGQVADQAVSYGMQPMRVPQAVQAAYMAQEAQHSKKQKKDVHHQDDMVSRLRPPPSPSPCCRLD